MNDANNANSNAEKAIAAANGANTTAQGAAASAAAAAAAAAAGELYAGCLYNEITTGLPDSPYVPPTGETCPAFPTGD
jgi:hypothetical protein